MKNQQTPPDAATQMPECNCLALRQAARHLTQYYDQNLSPTGLRTTQYSILVRLQRLGPLSINALARELVMDRTTVGRNMLPLERDGLITVESGATDRRSKELHLTKAGAARLRAARKHWAAAQKHFVSAFGEARALNLRNELHAVATSELGLVPESGRHKVLR